MACTVEMAGVPLLLLLLCLPWSQAARGVVLQPLKQGANRTEAALIIVPGASIRGEAYRPLAVTIQDASPLKLWVVLLEDFVLDTPNPLELGGAIDSSLTALRQRGMTSENVFVAGHSLGGMFVGEYGSAHASQLKGVLLFASYLTRDVHLKSYPLPVMHVSGDLDGQTRVTRIVDTFQQLQASVSQDPHSMVRTPVIVMPGVCHAQFASGPMPKAVVDTDLALEVSSEAAFRTIAHHSSAFMVAALGQQVDVTSRSQASVDLMGAYNLTATLLQPLIAMKTLDQNPQNSDGWVIQAQQMLAGLARSFGTITDEVKPDASGFLISKPSVMATGRDALTIHTFAHLTFNFNPMDISTHPSSPLELAYKMKSKEAVQNALNVTLVGRRARSVNARAVQLTCKDLNQAALSLALRSASPAARARYQSHGRPLFFFDDVEHSTGLTWSASSLDLREDGRGLNVTSHALLTPVDSFLFAGMHYCKGLSPYRAMEWIYVDSLRKHPI